MMTKKVRIIFLILCAWVAPGLCISSLDAEISLHISLLHGRVGDYTGQSMHDIDTAQALLSKDISTILGTPDPQRSLSAYIGELQTSLRAQSINLQTLRIKRDEQLTLRKQCTTQKKSSDREFYLSIHQGAGDESLTQIADESATHGSCAEQARIKARAYTLMLQQIEGYAQQLKRRISILQSNERFLLKYKDLIDLDPTTIIQVNRLIQEIN